MSMMTNWRIVKFGGWMTGSALLVALAGAAMLGQGPGPLEGPGSVIHQFGKYLMLAGLVVMLFGYRWNQIQDWLRSINPDAPLDPAARTEAINELMSSVGTPPVQPFVSAGPSTEGTSSPERLATPASGGATMNAESSSNPSTVADSADRRPLETTNAAGVESPFRPAAHQLPAPKIDRQVSPQNAAPQERTLRPTNFRLPAWIAMGVFALVFLTLVFETPLGLALFIQQLMLMALLVTWLVLTQYSDGLLRVFAWGAIVPTVCHLVRWFFRFDNVPMFMTGPMNDLQVRVTIVGTLILPFLFGGFAILVRAALQRPRTP